MRFIGQSDNAGERILSRERRIEFAELLSWSLPVYRASRFLLWHQRDFGAAHRDRRVYGQNGCWPEQAVVEAVAGEAELRS